MSLRYTPAGQDILKTLPPSAIQILFDLLQLIEQGTNQITIPTDYAKQQQISASTWTRSLNLLKQRNILCSVVTTNAEPLKNRYLMNPSFYYWENTNESA